MKHIIFLLAFFFILFSEQIIANPSLPPTGSVNGHVVEKENGIALKYAQVTIKGTHRGASVDNKGSFNFKSLKPGTYTLRVQSMGFVSQEKTITVTENKTEHIHFEMEEAPLEMDEVVVTASRNEVSKKEAPVVVNVLSERLFETVNSCDLSQSLSFQPGLRVENNCQNCSFTQVRINGLEGPYSQILINSRPVMSALSGVYGLEQIPVNMIERVETVRGGGSALFGSNAIAGTINIITKDPINNGYSVSNTASMIDKNTFSNSFNANAAFVSDDYRSGIALYQAYRFRDPWDENGDDFSEIGKLNTHSFGINSFIKPTLDSRLSIDYHTTNEKRRGGNKFDLQPHQSDITEQTEHLINGGGITYDQFTKDYAHKFSAYTAIQHIKRDSYYGSKQDENAYGKTKDLTWMGGLQGTSNIEGKMYVPAVLTYGLEYQYNDLNDKMLGYNRIIDQKVKIASGYIQSEWQMNKFNLLGGVRFDKHNMIDHLIVSPRVNMRYDFSENIQARLTYSTGFRAPQAFDEDLHVAIVSGEGQIIQLADDLKEERSNSFSASVDLYHRFGEYVQGNLLVEAFYTDLSDVFVLEEIGHNENDVQILERRNGKGARVMGLNFDGRLTWGRKNQYQMQLGYTLNRNRYKEAEKWSEDTEVEPTKIMPRAPKQYGYFTFTYNPFKTFKTMLSGTYTGEMKVPHMAGYIEKDRMESTPDFYDINIKLSYDFKLFKDVMLQINGGVQNIFNSYQNDLDKGIDRDASYVYGPSLPRNYFVGLKLTNL